MKMGKKYATHQSQIKVPVAVKNQNKYKDLITQVNKIANHCRQGSFQTKARYYQGMERFVRHLADQNLSKIRNIHDRHIVTYIREMQAQGLSASTIKTDLAAIRFFHDQIANARNIISDNTKLQQKYDIHLEKRHFGGVDRSWSEREFVKMCEKAVEAGQPEIRNVMELCRFQGLRIHEVTRLDRATAEKALRSGVLHVKGKGGLERNVPLRPEGRSALVEAMQRVNRGEKLFVPEGTKTHEVIKSCQNFITVNRDDIQSANREVNLHIHGLRHTYAKEEYQVRINQGIPKEQAKKEISELLGHHRAEITNIYLGGK